MSTLYWWDREEWLDGYAYNFPPLVEGPGDFAAAAIREELTLRPYPEEPYSFGAQIGWRACLNCGVPKPDVADRGGWCGACEGES